MESLSLQEVFLLSFPPTGFLLKLENEIKKSSVSQELHPAGSFPLKI
jgi:hypothetical protein